MVDHDDTEVPTAARSGRALIGRVAVLAAFEQVLGRVGRGRFQLVDIAGEPGMGKTCVLTALAGMAAERGMRVLWGRSSEYEQEVPLAMIVDALGDILEERADRVRERVPPEHLRLLARVFPGLDGDAAPGGEGMDRLVRYPLHRALRGLLDVFAAPSGLAVLLDDLHWADDASIELLDHLLRHPPGGRVLVAVAYRPAQAASWLGALSRIRHRLVQPIRLGPLTEEEAGRLLGRSVSRARLRRLHQISGGNPFYLQALARMPGRPEEIAERDGDLPSAVRAALMTELRGLPEEVVRVAQAAAVTADLFDPTGVAVAAQVSEAAAHAALDALVERDVIRSSPSGFAFRHPLVRHAVYDSAAAGWRIAAHRRLAGHLRRIGAPVAVRANHIARSIGPAGFGDEDAISTLTEAARTVAAQAPATAVRWLEAALRLLPEDRGTDYRRLEMITELARVQMVSGRLEAGRDNARAVLRRLPEGEHARRARAARFAAMLERMIGRPAESQALLLDELNRTPGGDPAVTVPLQLRLAAEQLFRGDYRAADQTLAENRGGYQDADPVLRAAAATMVPLPLYAAGRVQAALDAIDAADRLLAEVPEDRLAEWLDVYGWLCWTEVLVHRCQDAAVRFERAVGIARDTGQIYILTSLLAGQAQACGRLGRLAEARELAEESAELAALLRSDQSVGIARAVQSLLAGWAGEHDEALRLSAEAMAAAARSREWWAALARYAGGLARLAGGQTAAGVAGILAACDHFKAPVLDPGNLLGCCVVMAEVEAEQGGPGRAEPWAARARRLAHPAMPASRGLALLARSYATADPPASAALAGEAAELLDGQGLRLDAGRAALRAGLCHAAASARDAARGQFERAAAAFAGCGANALHQRTARELRRLGVHPPGLPGERLGRSTGPFGLSRRELEVALEVCAGATNAQIAERLFLSVRTVETHISHIFTKLGVGSRTGVVRYRDRLVNGDSGDSR